LRIGADGGGGVGRLDNELGGHDGLLMTGWNFSQERPRLKGNCVLRI
jgi:hypothetical protein